MDTELLALMFPEGILDYFEIEKYSKETELIRFYLKEKNIVPEEYTDEQVTSHGFLPEITLEDFPLRGNQVSLHIKRRRWLLKKEKTVVIRNWNMVAKGTRKTQELASFLKEIAR